MLLQFTVENFKSFDSPTTFSMRATGDTGYPHHVIGPEKSRAVRGAAIYGANNAGKSNLVLAMAFARDLIVKSRAESPLELSPFRRKEKDLASGFHWQFLHAGKLWSYGFDILKSRVVEEYLFAQSESEGIEEEQWFKRETDETGATQINFGEAFLSSIPTEDAQLLQLKAPRLDAVQLFLRACRDEKIAAIAPVFEWFEEVLLIVRAETEYDPLLWEAVENKQFIDFLSESVRDAGTGVHHLFPMRAGFSEKDIAQQLIGNFPVDNLGVGEYVSHKSLKNWGVVLRSGDQDYELISLYACFEAAEKMLCPLTSESEGTQRYIHLLPHFYRLRTRPTVLIVDELERRLHTLLTRRLVEGALNSPVMERNQFIFTTHDTNLIDSHLLRRDEIWFVDKDKNGETSLVSLAEYKIRPEDDWERGYLLGLFDGRPWFGGASGFFDEGESPTPTLEELQAALGKATKATPEAA